VLSAGHRRGLTRTSAIVGVFRLSDPKRVKDPLDARTHRRLTDREIAVRLLRDYVRPQWRRLGFAVACMGIAAAATAGTAWIMKPVIDEVFTERDSALLWPLSVAVLAIFVVKGLAAYGQQVLMNSVGRRIVARLQVEMFGRLVAADLAQFHAIGSGRLVSHFVSDVGALYGMVSNTITGIGLDLLTLVALTVLMFREDAILGAIAFVIFPAAVLPILQLGRRMRKVSRKTRTQHGSLSSQLSQVFQGIRHVKAYTAEERETKRMARIVQDLSRLQQKAMRIRTASRPIMEALSGVAIMVIILYGGSQVIGGDRTTGSFFSFITALLLAYEPLKRLANVNTSVQTGLVSAERVFGTIDAEPTIVDAPDARALTRVRGDLRLDGVHFAYGVVPALRGVSIDIPAGTTVALVGPSGAGKSTVLNLIPRFYDVDEGRVTIDGHDVRQVTQVSLRRQTALVSQEITLFDDTVAANIRYGRIDATDDEIEQAARDAAAHDFIVRLPDGYQTVIGEHGVRLSGGQRQRLSIARAMLKDAPILLLDEATSALDTESERQVQDALARLMAGRTTLMIAHRLSTVRGADKIYVMDLGRIVEVGSHAALIARDGLYARLWLLQTAEAPTAQTEAA
jgi:subfamily B ATP-binding cassette protein MsbA